MTSCHRYWTFKECTALSSSRIGFLLSSSRRDCRVDSHPRSLVWSATTIMSSDNCKCTLGKTTSSSVEPLTEGRSASRAIPRLPGVQLLNSHEYASSLIYLETVTRYGHCYCSPGKRFIGRHPASGQLFAEAEYHHPSLRLTSRSVSESEALRPLLVCLSTSG